ncbi:MutS domain III [Saccharicrinis carchari]|uniref:MutS domain III n=1 Tax=Saccharicrinis carchari TaxID=1168039 RepID=A0A521CKB7_SACCC|nr:hypothetical protein [Saccharicrinis carchari]SMO59862.1 MutS domain III [Saccharicrinis carchari]
MKEKARLVYTTELEKTKKEITCREIKDKNNGYFRLVLFLLIISCSFFLSKYFYICVTILCVIFTCIVVSNLINKNKLNYHKALYKLYNFELNHNSTKINLFDNGLTYIDPKHLYSNDLDLFGKNSIFEFINRCHSEIGSKTLANWLLYPGTSKVIKDRQLAVEELSQKLEFRKKVGVSGILNTENKHIQKWRGDPESVRKLRIIKFKGLALSIINVSLLFISVIYGVVLPFFVISITFSYFYMYSFQWKKIETLYKEISKLDGDLKYFRKYIAAIENESFSSVLLNNLKNEISLNNISGIKTTKKLQKYIQITDLRLNYVFLLFVNTFFYVDILMLYKIEKWKLENGKQLTMWQKIIGKYEALMSLSILHFNNNWCFPTIADEFNIEIVNAGHPLIPVEKCVTNSYKMDALGRVDILTGSNMSGKSTFLRSVGVNIVLALAGAPVFAVEMTISPLQLMTYMRIEDNLQENTSTFYAEIIRLRTILENIRNNSYSFLLLDELLRGTNSSDKKQGSIAIIEHILKNNSSSIIATHDLSIAKLYEGTSNAIRNYHFDIKVNNKTMSFDYKLCTGICNSSNATLLLKEIGLNVPKKPAI